MPFLGVGRSMLTTADPVANDAGGRPLVAVWINAVTAIAAPRQASTMPGSKSVT